MEYRKACETYMESPFDYENLKLEDIKKIINEYGKYSPSLNMPPK